MPIATGPSSYDISGLIFALGAFGVDETGRHATTLRSLIAERNELARAVVKLYRYTETTLHPDLAAVVVHAMTRARTAAGGTEHDPRRPEP